MRPLQGGYSVGVLASDKVAVLSDFAKISFKSIFSTPVNYMDCAIAELTSSTLATDIIVGGIGKINGVAKPKLNSVVIKVGRTTEATIGVINTLGTQIKIEFTKGKVALFKNQIISSNYNEGGDSGAVMINEENKVVGLMFAGRTNPMECIFTDIDIILKYFGVTVFVR